MTANEVPGDGMTTDASQGRRPPAASARRRCLLLLLYVGYAVYVVAMVSGRFFFPGSLEPHFTWFDISLSVPLFPGILLSLLVGVVVGPGRVFRLYLMPLSAILGCLIAPLAVAAIIRRRKARRQGG